MSHLFKIRAISFLSLFLSIILPIMADTGKIFSENNNYLTFF